MKIVGIAVAAWFSGLGAYLAALHILWGQQISSGDLRAVVFWSALAALVTSAVLFGPVMFRLREWVVGGPANSWWVFVVVGGLLGVVPVLMIVSIWSNNIGRALLSPEAGLFYGLFGTFGSVFGGSFCVRSAKQLKASHPEGRGKGRSDGVVIDGPSAC